MRFQRDELRVIMKEMGNPLSPAQLDAAMTEMDSDGSGEIDFVEFFTWWAKLSSTQTLRARGQDPQDQYYKEMFDTADTGGEGSLDAYELRALMIDLGCAI
jgi:Ca2+-binding EF-hand superfamily protein